MARKSVSQQLSELREYTARLEVELDGYKAIVAAYNAPRARPVVQTGPRVRKPFESLSERAAAFCAANGVKTCTREQVLNWRP